MKAKKFSSRLLAMLLTAMMVLSILSTGAFAEGEGGVSAQLDSDSPIQLKKTATLEDDGTYTIDLEAYVTGEVVAQVEKKSQPTDIILVLDQSGSMSYSMSGLPNGQYSTAGTITNTQAYEGAYYYKVGNTYYPVTVKYASTGTIEKYIDNWDSLSYLKKEGLKKHWKKEINNFETSIKDRILELKERGDL